jgi:tetratricopeptide (TPR) repeat protein
LSSGERTDKPELVGTIEKLCQIAVRLEQFYNPVLTPYPYLEETLRRDPDCAFANTFLGILQCKHLLFAEAETSLRRALARLEQRYTQPREGEAYYSLGLAVTGQGRDAEAAEHFHRAVWYSEWFSVAKVCRAQICARAGDLMPALHFVSEALECGGRDCVGHELRAILLRALGRPVEHADEVARLGALDPLNAAAAGEQSLAGRETSSDFVALLRDEPAN